MSRMNAFSNSVPIWRVRPKAVALDRNEVHVWQAALDQNESQIANYHRTLAADERARAERFHFSADRRRFVVARGALRAILGLYLKRAPECLSFRYSSYGKPELALEEGADQIYFNLSHSNGMALYAVSCGRQVGVDLECLRSNLEVEQIAERFFSRREVSALHALPAAVRRYAFFLCWTRKEAYIKARGEGLSLPLSQFDVSLTPGDPAALLCTRPDSDEALHWSLQDLTPEPSGYAAALAVEGSGGSLALWKWSASSENTP
jgi:4'-phosphopantetheinyl transferase